jgi:hypothetical protein
MFLSLTFSTINNSGEAIIIFVFRLEFRIFSMTLTDAILTDIQNTYVDGNGKQKDESDFSVTQRIFFK